MARKPAILFGPFVGEFGWEQSFFAGYVRRFAAEAAGDYDIHVASFPGRAPLYGRGVTVHAHPDWFRELRLSANAYVCDQWFGDWPAIPDGASYARCVALHHERLLAYYRAEVGPFRRALAPAGLFTCLFDPARSWGTWFSPLGRFSPAPVTLRIEPEVQLWRPIETDPADEDMLSSIAPDLFAGDRPAVAVLPRRRTGRRPDKNWPEENYHDLIARLLEHPLRPRVVVIGEPGGCWFAEGEVPHGAIDLIHVPDERRLGLQVAAARRCRFAVGGLSGAMLVMLGFGVPTIEWGHASAEPETRRQNMMGTPMHYLAHPAPSVDAVWLRVAAALDSGRVADRTDHAVGGPPGAGGAEVGAQWRLYQSGWRRWHERIGRRLDRTLLRMVRPGAGRAIAAPALPHPREAT
ncbi:MAG: hypothetical protein IT557_12515 [Alphaproteobacteria bacterium]|nr:hypothetical protein [Alphaproteobacteria bacterium]